MKTQIRNELLGWELKTKFVDGLNRTTNGYFGTKMRKDMEQMLDRRLKERQFAPTAQPSGQNVPAES